MKHAVKWKRRFDEPILLPDGERINTLGEAIAYLAKTTPISEREMPAITTAAEILTNTAERGWPMMMARMAVLKALHRHEKRVFSDRKDPHWGRRKLKRSE